jgi:hypothetical protein
MRDLDFNELQFVSGANRSPAPPSSGCGCSPCPPTLSPSKSKNNNGFGNGAESGPAPGNSGASDPRKDQNYGTRQGTRYAR